MAGSVAAMRWSAPISATALRERAIALSAGPHVRFQLPYWRLRNVLQALKCTTAGLAGSLRLSYRLRSRRVWHCRLRASRAGPALALVAVLSFFTVASHDPDCRLRSQVVVRPCSRAVFLISISPISPRVLHGMHFGARRQFRLSTDPTARFASRFHSWLLVRVPAARESAAQAPPQAKFLKAASCPFHSCDCHIKNHSPPTARNATSHIKSDSVSAITGTRFAMLNSAAP
jgi:hypothetical protein